MGDTLITNREDGICDICGKSLLKGDGTREGGFGFCKSCVGDDSNSKYEPCEKILNNLKNDEFSYLDYENKLSSISTNELIEFKYKYDKLFRKYWSSGGGSTKFQVISLEEFIKRLKNRDFFDKYGRSKS